jgi:thiol-disulfide isomerase/thioredoxin
MLASDMRSLIFVIVALLVHDAFAAVPTLGELRARNFEVVTVDGKRVPLTALLPIGSPALVEFWATWCVPCRKTIPHLIDLNKRYSNGKLTIIGLTVEDPVKHTAKVQRFVSELGVNYPIAFASAELFRFMNQRESIGLPKVLVYDAAGNVVEHIITYSPLTRRRVEKAVSRAIAAK